MPEIETTTINYLPQVAKFVSQAGGDVGAWLAGVGLSESSFTDSTTEIPIGSYVQLIQDAAVVSGEPALGLLIGYELTPATHGVVGLAALAAGTLAEAMEIAAKYAVLRTSLVSIELHKADREYRLRITGQSALGAGGVSVLETVVTTLRNAAVTLTGDESCCKRIDFSFPQPPYAMLARELLQSPVFFDQPSTELSFEWDRAHAKLPRRDKLVLGEALAVCRRQLKRTVSSTRSVSQLERVLRDKKRDIPSFALAAQLLGVNPRTLHRKLAAEGSSYSVILEKVRRQLAMEYLHDQGKSVQETAELLGYSDSANFRRAFKRWYQKPPSEFLKK